MRIPLRRIHPPLLALWLAVVVPLAYGGGLYLGAGVGQAQQTNGVLAEETCTAFGVTCSVDDTDQAYQIFGGYQFGNYLALEAGYVSLGETVADLPLAIQARSETRGVTLAILPSVPIGENFSLYGKAGAFIWDVELSVQSAGLGSEAVEGAGTGTVFGVGAALRLGERGKLRLEWTRHTIDEQVTINNTPTDLKVDVDMLSANVLLEFGGKRGN